MRISLLFYNAHIANNAQTFSILITYVVYVVWNPGFMSNNKKRFWIPECEIIVVECVRWVGGDTAAAAVEGLVVHLAVGFGAALGGVDAENARDQDAELEKDDGGAGCDDDGQRRAHHVLLAVGPSLNEHLT